MAASEQPIIVSIVVAIADNGVIGNDGRLPWRLKSDLRRFRRLTMGHPLIMGRKTFQSIGRPLDGRASIVVSRSLAEGATGEITKAEGLMVAADWAEAIGLARAWAADHGVHEVFVIGGVQLFEAALPHCRRIYLAKVHGAPSGNVRWQVPSGEDWREISRQGRPAGPGDDYPVTDVILERRRA